MNNRLLDLPDPSSYSCFGIDLYLVIVVGEHSLLKSVRTASASLNLEYMSVRIDIQVFVDF